MQLPFNPIVIVISLAIGATSAYLGHKRGRNPYLWFAIGFFFGIFGIFAIIFATSRKKAATEAKREAVFIIDGPLDKFWYYLDPTHKQQGPMSHNALTEAWKTGEIDSSTYVWHEEMAEWKPLKETLKLES
jgi:hypothetical protein